MHGTLGDMHRAFELDKQVFGENDPWSGFLSSVAWALRSTTHSTIDAIPAELVFGRDMILPAAFAADWESIRAKRQSQKSKDNKRKNKGVRLDYDYSVGDRVLTLDPISKRRKLERATDGPFIVTRVHDNGIVRIQKGAVDTDYSV